MGFARALPILRTGSSAFAFADDDTDRLAGSFSSLVIASAAKQSRIFPRRDSGLLRCARNDDCGGISFRFQTESASVFS